MLNGARARLLFIRIFYKYLIIVGFVSDMYDIPKHDISRKKWCNAYVSCVNILLVFTLPYALFITSESGDGKKTRSELLGQTEMANALIYFVAVVIIVGTRSHREYCFRQGMKAYYAVEEEYFGKLPIYADIERRYGLIFIGKVFTTLSQLPISLYLNLLNHSADTRTLVLALYFGNVGYILHGIMFHHFLSLWYASRNFERLNREFEKTLQRLHLLQEHGNGIFNTTSEIWRQLARLSAEEVRLIADVHWRMTVVMERFNNTFKILINAVLLTYIIKNITAGYYAVLAYGGRMETNRSTAVFSCIIYLLLIADLYLFYMMCEHVTRNSEKTAELLKKFSELDISHKGLEKQCEAFALQLKQRKFSVNMAGLYTLNMKTFLALWGFIIRHTILLVQSDYEDRYRQVRDHNK